MLDIFVRANEGGTKLSKSDLLLSMVTSSWDGVNAREEMFNFVDRVNTQLTRRNDFDKDFIMKSCLVLTDLPVATRCKTSTTRTWQRFVSNGQPSRRPSSAASTLPIHSALTETI